MSQISQQQLDQITLCLSIKTRMRAESERHKTAMNELLREAGEISARPCTHQHMSGDSSITSGLYERDCEYCNLR